MAKYSRIEVFNTMEKTGLVPLFYHSDIEVAKEVVTACYRGGARVIEFTNRGEFAHEVFAKLVKYAQSGTPRDDTRSWLSNRCRLSILVYSTWSKFCSYSSIERRYSHCL